ncbi:cyclase family protein [Rhodococcus sp. (in: high G+C Gram-positive bacteria)]|uniref:cyclase family protein n=1 Tax=Rhodococcus sp. TaxID=1831 RepID=UPI00257EA510|nr:cyclase family protein [Rhodococcus sp. (in: high G+C Gram-positive bacteria)]MBQ7804044.1 cyclase family protein [Rhodococcus sp. (in: high G+C Gram-positive bacteria)]
MTDPLTAPSITELGKLVRSRRIHDVTPELGPDTPMFFPTPAPVVHKTSQHERDGAAANTWEIHEHSGAHVDAPFHFDAAGKTIDQVAADVLFMRPFKKFDLSPYDLQPGAPATLDQIKAAGDRAGFTVAAGDVAIVDFGYDKYLPGHPDAREPQWWGRNQPGLSDEVCEYLAAAQVIAVASDTSACDLAVADGEMSAGSGHGHHFLPKGILIIECLRGLSEVPATGLIAALPLRLTGGTGSPLRVLLLTD